jgi:3-oxoisoapionate decarboxylase
MNSLFLQSTQPINRREALLMLSTAGSALMLGKATAASSDEMAPPTQMGIVTYAFGLHQKNQWGGRHQGLFPALALLEESHSLGAAGIQADLAGVDATQAAELRRRAEKYQMYIEVTVVTPRAAEDVARFENDIRNAKTAGATLGRTAILPGRRYEEFKSLAEFRQAEQHGLQSLQWAEPILARQQFRLAVENHKDQRIAEKLETIKRISSQYVGICVDVGNSVTLMEDPLEIARAFAPWALTVHFKDQAVRENEDGFWFADVALGEGFIDLPAVMKILRDAKPNLHLNLETITRDPLNVPVLKSDFWVTMPDTPASELARTLRLVKTKGSPKPFVAVSQLPVDQQLAFELRNVQRSINYARERLGLI